MNGRSSRWLSRDLKDESVLRFVRERRKRESLQRARPLHDLQLDRAAVVGRTIARKTAAGKCHLSVCTQSEVGCARQSAAGKSAPLRSVDFYRSLTRARSIRLRNFHIPATNASDDSRRISRVDIVTMTESLVFLIACQRANPRILMPHPLRAYRNMNARETREGEYRVQNDSDDGGRAEGMGSVLISTYILSNTYTECTR